MFSARRVIAALGLLAGIGPVYAAGETKGRAESMTAPTKHKDTNRLIDSTSPYLLQHAHNPVDWHPWGPEAFEKAVREDKPVF